MSATTSQITCVTSVSYRFVLKWTLKAKQLNDMIPARNCHVQMNDDGNSSVLRSDLYHFRTVKDLRFYLEIKRTWPYMHIKGSKMWSFDLVYVFLVSKERAFKLNDSPHLSFMSEYYLSYASDAEDVTIHCMIVASPARPNSSVEEVDLYLKESQNMVDFDGMPDITYPNNYTDVMVIDFIRKGDIPSFTIDIAIKIIRETNEHKCEALKILCTEYLMGNITSQSIRKISKAALDFGLLALERKCIREIADGSIRTK